MSLNSPNNRPQPDIPNFEGKELATESDPYPQEEEKRLTYLLAILYQLECELKSDKHEIHAQTQKNLEAILLLWPEPNRLRVICSTLLDIIPPMPEQMEQENLYVQLQRCGIAGVTVDYCSKVVAGKLPPANYPVQHYVWVIRILSRNREYAEQEQPLGMIDRPNLLRLDQEFKAIANANTPPPAPRDLDLILDSMNIIPVGSDSNHREMATIIGITGIVSLAIAATILSKEIPSASNCEPESFVSNLTLDPKTANDFRTRIGDTAGANCRFLPNQQSFGCIPDDGDYRKTFIKNDIPKSFFKGLGTTNTASGHCDLMLDSTQLKVDCPQVWLHYPECVEEPATP